MLGECVCVCVGGGVGRGLYAWRVNLVAGVYTILSQESHLVCVCVCVCMINTQTVKVIHTFNTCVQSS